MKLKRRSTFQLPNEYFEVTIIGDDHIIKVPIKEINDRFKNKKNNKHTAKHKQQYIDKIWAQLKQKYNVTHHDLTSSICW